MKNSVTPVIIATVVLMIYALLADLGIAPRFVMTIFLCSPFLVVGMVFSVLRSKDTTERTFDDYFYDDVDIKRSGRE